MRVDVMKLIGCSSQTGVQFSSAAVNLPMGSFSDKYLVMLFIVMLFCARSPAAAEVSCSSLRRVSPATVAATFATTAPMFSWPLDDRH